MLATIYSKALKVFEGTLFQSWGSKFTTLEGTSITPQIEYYSTFGDGAIREEFEVNNDSNF